MAGTRILGLVVLFVDDEQFGFINLVGDIDPGQIGRIARRYNIEMLERFESELGGSRPARRGAGQRGESPMSPTTRPATTRPAITLLLAAAALLSTGCFWAPTLDPIRHEIERTERYPVRSADPECASVACRWRWPAASPAPPWTTIRRRPRSPACCAHVKGVEIAVYEVERMSGSDRGRWVEELALLGDRRGWRLAARIETTTRSARFSTRRRRARSAVSTSSRSTTRTVLGPSQGPSRRGDRRCHRTAGPADSRRRGRSHSDEPQEASLR